MLDATILKNLNVKECIGLAKYLYPERNWVYYNNLPDDLWDGHDLVSGKSNLRGYTASLRIDYREDVTTEYPRITFQLTGSNREICDTYKVIEYLRRINKL